MQEITVFDGVFLQSISASKNEHFNRTVKKIAEQVGQFKRSFYPARISAQHIRRITRDPQKK
jgi:hypothetical protein